MRIRILIAALSFVVVPVMAAAPAVGTDSAYSFVKAFYGWYVPRVFSPHEGFAAKDALKEKRSSFDDHLAHALDEDFAAQAKSPDYIVGIDFDPFLNSQDPCEHYVEGKVTRVTDRYDIEVMCSDTSSRNPNKPDVIAEVKQQGNSWVLVDFIYPADGSMHKSDLMGVLKLLKEERENSKDKSSPRS